MRIVRSFLVIGALASLSACRNSSAASRSSPALEGKKSSASGSAAHGTGSRESRAVATYDGRRVSLDQIDHALGQELFAMRAEKMHQMIVNDLLQREAAKRGVSVDELISKEVNEKVSGSAPSEKELAEMFAKVSAEGNIQPGVTYASFRERVLETNLNRKEVELREDFFDDLMRRAKVRMDLEALGQPRVVVGGDGPSRGRKDAPVTIIEFADFESPFCAQANETVVRLLREHDGVVRFVFRQNPRDRHAHAPKAAEAALCAHAQERYWEFRQALFSQPGKLSTDDLTAHARNVGLDVPKFSECLASGKSAAAVAADKADAARHDLRGSPEFVLNGIRLSGAQPFRTFRRLIEAEQARL